MNYGDVLRHKETGQYATLHYSFAGGSVHTYDEKNNALGKSLGEKLSVIAENWETVDLPDGYEWDESGLFIRKIKSI